VNYVCAECDDATGKITQAILLIMRVLLPCLGSGKDMWENKWKTEIYLSG